MSLHRSSSERKRISQRVVGVARKIIEAEKRGGKLYRTQHVDVDAAAVDEDDGANDDDDDSVVVHTCAIKHTSFIHIYNIHVSCVLYARSNGTRIIFYMWRVPYQIGQKNS